MTDSYSLHTIRDFIRYAATEFAKNNLFYGHGTDNAWDEACALVLQTLHLDVNLPQGFLSSRLTESECNIIHDRIQRRIKNRTPLPYITQQANFCDLNFYVDERVLIPRSSIAEMIHNQFSPWIDPNNVESILDLCTGSACIAIACAYAFPYAQIIASDISEDALNVAKINLQKHNLENNIKLYQSDLFANLPQIGFDIIVSNPPYVSFDEMTTLPAEYLHEPKLGLAADHDGIEIVLKILRDAKKYLNENGILIVEVGNSESILMERYSHIPFTWVDFENSEGGVFVLTQDQLKTIALD